MKKCFYYMLGVILLATAFTMTSCSLDNPPPVLAEISEEALNAASNELKLMQRTANNDGSWDNIVDGSSCLSVRFPYTVTVNGLDLTIDSKEDLQLIEDLFDASDFDEDVLNLVFPITVTLADYSEVTLNDKDELGDLVAECIEGGDDEDIECIDFVYPITLLTFNPDFVQTGSVTVTSDSELRRFFSGLETTDLVGVDYPISLELYDGTKVTITNNAELRDAIERAIYACDEDDDNDFGDDDFTEERLDALLVECPWLVKEVKRDNQYTTTDYEDYVLNFKEDGSVVARDRQGNLLNGEWSTRVSDYRVVISLEFEFLAEFNLVWLVDDIDDDRIKLFSKDGDKIIMKQYCEDQAVECTEAFIKETLSTCVWIPSQGDSSFLDSLSIDFSNMNIHVYNPNGEVVDEGNWELEGNVLVFNSLSMELANYIGEWEVIECSAARFVLKRNEETLVLEKLCE